MLKKRLKSKTIGYYAKVSIIDFSEAEIKKEIKKLKDKINAIIMLLDLDRMCMLESIDDVDDIYECNRINKKRIEIDFYNISFEKIFNNYRQIKLTFFTKQKKNLEINVTDLGEITFTYYYKENDPTEKINQILH